VQTSHPDLFLALDRYLQAIEQKAPGEILLPLIKDLDAWETRLGKDASPMLHHYLQRKSYRKAWLYLQGQEEA
jgi:hypothetical protein